MAEGGKESPASIMGASAGSPSGLSTGLGGSIGDMGVGEERSGEEGVGCWPSTALPLPLSILGAWTSGPRSASEGAGRVSSGKVPEDNVLFFWRTLRRSAIRSLTVALRCGRSAGRSLGEEVYLSSSSPLLGENLTLEMGMRGLWQGGGI
jgi:hypothetical protein